MTAPDATAPRPGERHETCCSEQQLVALLEGDCQQQEIAAIRSHLQDCPFCRNRCMEIAARQMTAARAGHTVSSGRNIGAGCLLVFIITSAILGVYIFFSNFSNP